MREIKNSLARETWTPFPFTSRIAGSKLSIFFPPFCPSFFCLFSHVRSSVCSFIRSFVHFSLHPRFATGATPSRAVQHHYQRHIRNLIERLVKNRISRGSDDRFVVACTHLRAGKHEWLGSYVVATGKAKG